MHALAQNKNFNANGVNWKKNIIIQEANWLKLKMLPFTKIQKKNLPIRKRLNYIKTWPFIMKRD